MWGIGYKRKIGGKREIIWEGKVKERIRSLRDRESIIIMKKTVEYGWVIRWARRARQVRYIYKLE